MKKWDLDFTDPSVRAAATALAQIGANKQKKAISEEAKDRKAVNAAVEAFWKKASLDARRAFLKQLEGFAHESNVARLQRYGAILPVAAPVVVPPSAPAQPVAKKDTDKAE